MLQIKMRHNIHYCINATNITDNHLKKKQDDNASGSSGISIEEKHQDTLPFLTLENIIQKILEDNLRKTEK